MMKLSEAVAAFIDEQRVARIATVTPTGAPHIVPICVARDGDTLVIASESSAGKVLNLRGDPHAVVCFDEYSEDWSRLKQVIVEGRAELIAMGPEFAGGRDLLYDKFEQYETDFPIEEGGTLILRIEADRVSASGL
jgi:nitroimidazol reductase NimA-like FMN-containing flavoprotein (pyridoxamine 5'-phosphate oxidase superfamily)